VSASLLAEFALSPRPRDPSWRARAACGDADPDLFFPPDGVSAEPGRRICARCPVRQECLDYAISNGIAHGTWGGLSERDRRVLRARRLRALRRDRDRAILAAHVGGLSEEAIGRALGLTRSSVSRIVLRHHNQLSLKS